MIKEIDNFASRLEKKLNPKVPFPRSYWVVPGKFLAGEYPGSKIEAELRKKIRSLADAGIRCIINLMAPDEIDREGEPFALYEPFCKELTHEIGREIKCLRFSIIDMKIPTRALMVRILNAIDDSLKSNLPVYVHCWGGIGRTGTVVGCWLQRTGETTSDIVLDHIRILRQHSADARRRSPEASEQEKMILSWKIGE